MNRRNSIITGLTAITAVASLTSTAKAEITIREPRIQKIRALLKAHDDAMTATI